MLPNFGLLRFRMTRLGRCVFLLALTAVFSYAPSNAQSTSPSSQPPTGQQTPPANVATLHTGAKLVVVDVIVRDKNGHPIHGLTRNDFVISESGKRQTLNSFEEYAKPAAPMTPPAMPQLPRGMFTNFTPVGPKGPLNVLLFDGINTAVVDQGYFRQQLLDYIDHVPPGTRIAIFGMADHLYLLQGFTSDPRVLRAALSRMKANPHAALAGSSGTTQASLMEALTDPSGGPSATMSAGQSALMTSAVDTFIEHVSSVEKAMQVRLTLDEMTQLGRWLLQFPGRKNVLWASSAFPLGGGPDSEIPTEDSDIFVRMINTFAEAQVSVYPIDPRGVRIDASFGADSGSLNQISEAKSRSSGFYSSKADEQGTMQAFASDTGGVPFYNRNNVTQGIGEAIDSGANYYTLSYSPSEKKTAGEWRSLHVELANPQAYKGAQLFYRRGYYADNLKVPAHKTGTAEVTEDPNAPSIESTRNAHLAMLHGAPALQDIPFTTRVLPASTSTEDTVAAGNTLDAKDPIKPPYRRYDVDCAAAARYFSLAERPNGHHVGAVQAAVFVYAANGKLLNAASRTLQFDLSPEEYAQFQRLGFREHLEVSAPAKGESFFRIGIEEKTSGRIGALEVATSAVSNLPPAEYAQPPAPQTTGAKSADSSLHP